LKKGSDKEKIKYLETKEFFDIVNNLQIRLASSSDMPLISEYKLETLPALVFYRDRMPILFEGNLNDHVGVSEWLLVNRHTGDYNEELEDVEFEKLDLMIKNLKNLLVFYYDNSSDQNQMFLEKLNKDCSMRNIHIIKSEISKTVANKLNIKISSIVLYKNTVPKTYEGDHYSELELKQWIFSNIDSTRSNFEDFESLIENNMQLVVFFCKYIAYGVIALTHTCYLLKNYNSFEFKKYLPSMKKQGIHNEL